jgi:hypothetical protein
MVQITNGLFKLDPFCALAAYRLNLMKNEKPENPDHQWYVNRILEIDSAEDDFLHGLEHNSGRMNVRGLALMLEHLEYSDPFEKEREKAQKELRR